MPAFQADDWPEIGGISPAIVREQIGGDARLFLVLLRKLVDDQADLPVISETATAETLPSLGTRMHKLKGASGTLGATALFALAAQAEAAAAAGDLDGFGRQTATLAEELAALDVRVARAEAIARTRIRGDPHSRDLPDPADPADLDDLARLLRGQNLMALGRFEAMQQQLDGLFGEDRVAALRDHIDKLRFDAAADLLETCRREVPSG